MKRERIKELIKLIATAPVSCGTHQSWGMALADALSETDEDAAFERLEKRFSQPLLTPRLGSCTKRPLAA